MSSVINFCFALSLLCGFVRVHADLNKYSSLVLDVHKFYATSAVFFVRLRNKWHFEDYTIAQTVCRDFSRKHVFTVIMDFRVLQDRENWRRGDLLGRPLVVIVLRTLDDIDKFNATTGFPNVWQPIWLVIFVNDEDSETCEYCRSPTGNDFHLRFDTEMLVVCCDNEMLKEWWSARENITRMSDFAIWKKNDELKLLVGRGLYARRPDVEGVGLRVCTVLNSALVTLRGDKIEGLYGEILTELKNAMNFTITKTLVGPGFGVWHPRMKRWGGAVSRMIRDEADLGVADFAITSERRDVVDFTIPLHVARNCLYIRDFDGSTVQWSGYFQPFTGQIWMALLLLMVIAPLLLAVIKMHKISMSLVSITVENYLCVWGIFCQQGLCGWLFFVIEKNTTLGCFEKEFPVATSLRIAYFSIFISALVISAAYSGSLVSYLTLTTSGLPFNNFEEFANDGTYKLAVYRNHSHYDLFASANGTVFEKMMKLMKPLEKLPTTIMSGWEQLCQQRVALYTNDVSKKQYNKKIECKVVTIDTSDTDTLAMIIPAGSQYRRVINYHIQRFHDSGVLSRLKSKYFTNDLPAEPQFDVVTLPGVVPVLAALAVGIVIAFVVLSIEIIYHSFNANSRKKVPAKIFRVKKISKPRKRF